MKDTSVFLIIPPLARTSESKVALGFMKLFKEVGFSDLYGVYFKIPNLTTESLEKDFPEYYQIVKSSKIKLIKGPIFSGILDDIILKIVKTVKHIDLMVNLYYTEIPVGLDLSYVIYPSFIFTNKEQIRRKYKSISKIYFDFNYKILSKLVKSKKLVCSSKYIRELVKNTIGQECDIVYPPILEDREIINADYNKENLVVGVGKFVEPKHWDEFIQIAKIVKEKKRDVEFKIIGGLNEAKSSKSYFKILQEMAKGTVELLTDVPEKEKWEILKRAKVVLHCMRNDNVSLGVAEAMSVGAVPVAYKSTGSWMDILEEGKLGFAYSSVEEGAKYVLNLIENYDLYYKMKNLSFNKAKEFTYAVFKSKVLPVMNALLDSK